MKLFRAAFSITLLIFGSLSARAQESFNFLPSFEAEAPPPKIGGSGKVSLGVYSETMIPFSSPFSTQTQSKQDMRYQVPVGFGMELAVGITNSLEFALSGGYEHFETQQFTGIQSTSGTTLTRQFDRVNYTFYPIMAAARYRFGTKHWSPEVEVAGGAALGKIKVRSTVLNSTSISEGGPFIKARASFGYAFNWAEGYSLHFHVGYAGSQINTKSYVTSDYTVTQNRFHHGIFVRGWARYHF